MIQVKLVDMGRRGSRLHSAQPLRRYRVLGRRMVMPLAKSPGARQGLARKSAATGTRSAMATVSSVSSCLRV